MRNRNVIDKLILPLMLMLGASTGCLGAANPPNYVPDGIRTGTMSWGVVTIVPQAEIKSEIINSNAAIVMGGGLLGALIDAGVNSSRAKKAEAAIQPLRDSLSGFNFDDAARDLTASAASDVSWLKPIEQRVSKDDSQPGLLGLLDSSNAEQVLFADYGYSLTPNGDQLSVLVTLSAADKAPPAGKKPEDRAKRKYLVYTQQLRVIDSLSNPGKDAAANVARWSANDGALARKTMTSELVAIKGLIVRSLTESDADATALAKKRKSTELLDGGALSTDGTNYTLTRTVVE